MKKKLLWALAGFLGIMMVFTVLSRAADSVGIPRVSTVKAEQKVISHLVSAAGKVKQNQEQAVFTEADQRVKAIHVIEGQQVEEGELLFEIDRELLEEQILMAKEELQKQELQRQDTISSKQAGAVNKANDQASANEDYQDAVDDGNEAVQKAKDAWDLAVDALNDWDGDDSGAGTSEVDTVEEALQETLDEKKEAYEDALKERKEIEAAEEQSGLDEAIKKEERAKSEYQTAETALTQYQEQKNAADATAQQTSKEELEQKVEAAQAAYEQAVKDMESQVKSAAKGIQSANSAEASNHADEVEQIGIEQQQRKLQKLEKLKEQEGKVLSPVKGIVSKVSIMTGDRTSDGTAILLADISSGLCFTAQVPKDQEKYIARLDEVVLKTDNDKEITGLTINTISVNNEDSSLLDVTIQLPENALEMGVGATMKVNKKSEPYATCIPLSALYKEDNQYYVFVMEEQETILGTEQTVRRVDVTVQDKNAEYAAVAAGSITADQEIITDSEKTLEAGDRVRLDES